MQVRREEPFMTFRVVVALAMVSGVAAAAQAAVTPLTVGGPTSSSDVIIYEETSPGTLTVNNSLNTALGLTGILAGNAAAAGGNVELFGSSEVPGYTLPAFQVLTPVTLSGTAAGHTLVARSLTGSDWFGAVPNYSYGANNLANQWFENFMTTFGSAPAVAALVNANKPSLYAQFLASNGPQRLSDPNLAYANFDDALLGFRIGTEGTDGSINSAIALYLVSVGHPELVSQIPPNVQASELVAVSVDGGPTQYLYSFSGTPSGLSTTDPTESYTTNFENVAFVPEPASLGVLGLGAAALMLRKRR
jgi:hypothetical protein